MDLFDQRETVDEAKARVKSGLSEGIECPCCGLFAKRYWRSIYHLQVVRMVMLYRRSQLVTVANLDRNGHELATLKHWDIVEAEELTLSERKSLGARSRGAWRLTQKGRLFVERKITVPKIAVVFNDTVEWFEGPQVSIAECVKKNFSFDEIWNGPDQ